MLIRWKMTENTPLRYVAEGTEAEVDDALACELIDTAIAEEVRKPAERVAKPRGKAAAK
jgi:hypothetical protein